VHHAILRILISPLGHFRSGVCVRSA
jgi:hypothetical protein